MSLLAGLLAATPANNVRNSGSSVKQLGFTPSGGGGEKGVQIQVLLAGVGINQPRAVTLAQIQHERKTVQQAMGTQYAEHVIGIGARVTTHAGAKTNSISCECFMSGIYLFR